MGDGRARGDRAKEQPGGLGGLPEEVGTQSPPLPLAAAWKDLPMGVVVHLMRLWMPLAQPGGAAGGTGSSAGLPGQDEAFRRYGISFIES